MRQEASAALRLRIACAPSAASSTDPDAAAQHQDGGATAPTSPVRRVRSTPHCPSIHTGHTQGRVSWWSRTQHEPERARLACDGGPTPSLTDRAASASRCPACPACPTPRRCRRRRRRRRARPLAHGAHQHCPPAALAVHLRACRAPSPRHPPRDRCFSGHVWSCTHPHTPSTCNPPACAA